MTPARRDRSEQSANASDRSPRVTTVWRRRASRPDSFIRPPPRPRRAPTTRRPTVHPAPPRVAPGRRPALSTISERRWRRISGISILNRTDVRGTPHTGSMRTGAGSLAQSDELGVMIAPIGRGRRSRTHGRRHCGRPGRCSGTRHTGCTRANWRVVGWASMPERPCRQDYVELLGPSSLALLFVPV